MELRGEMQGVGAGRGVTVGKRAWGGNRSVCWVNKGVHREWSLQNCERVGGGNM